jgi:hypothetical protein
MLRPLRIVAQAAFLSAALVLTVAACGAAVSQGTPALSASHSPSASSVSPTERTSQGVDPSVSNGDCVYTDVPIAGVSLIREFRAVDCASAEARYRVLTIVVTKIMCPETTDYTLTRTVKVYCLSNDLTGRAKPPFDYDVVAGNCVVLERDFTSVTALHRVGCKASDAQYKVVKVEQILTFNCPAGADTRVTLNRSLAQTLTLCLKKL